MDVSESRAELERRAWVERQERFKDEEEKYQHSLAAAPLEERKHVSQTFSELRKRHREEDIRMGKRLPGLSVSMHQIMWARWIEVAVEHELDARQAYLGILANPNSDSLLREFRASLVTVTSAAFTTEALFGDIKYLIPAQPRRKRHLNLRDAFSTAFGVAGPTDERLARELKWVFTLRVISNVLGERLLERIEEVLARNEITRSVALEEIAPIHDRLTEVSQHLSELLTALEFFGISQDDLIDEFEVGVAIPRDAVDSKLPELGKAFIQLQKILAPFEELAGEGRPDLKVRAIASSEFSLFLAASASAVLIIAKAIQQVVETYDKILDIKRKRAEMANLVPEEALAEIDAHANRVMAESGWKR